MSRISKPIRNYTPKNQNQLTGLVRQHQQSMLKQIVKKVDIDTFLFRTNENYLFLQSLQEQKQQLIERIFILHQQQIQGNEQVGAVYEDISSKNLQNYDLKIEYEELQILLSEYLQKDSEAGQKICEQITLSERQKVIQQDIQALKKEIRQMQEQVKEDNRVYEQIFNHLKLLGALSKLQIAIDREKRKMNENKKRLDELDLSIYQRVDYDCDNMLRAYVNEKSEQLKDIRVKYGRQYYEKMIQEVKSEFREVYSMEIHIIHQKFQSVIQRLFQIEGILGKNKQYVNQLQSDLESFKRQIKFIPNASQKLQFEATSLDEQETQYYQNIKYIAKDFVKSIKNQDSDINIYVELQDLKKSIIQLEDKMSNQGSNTPVTQHQILSIKKKLSSLKIEQLSHTKSFSCNFSNILSPLIRRNSPCFSEYQNNSIPSVQIELLPSIQLSNVSNSGDFMDMSMEEPKHTPKQISCYQLSFNTNNNNESFGSQISRIENSQISRIENSQTCRIDNIQTSRKENSQTSRVQNSQISRIENSQTSRIENSQISRNEKISCFANFSDEPRIPNTLLYMRVSGEGKYDPIEDNLCNPSKYGFEMTRLTYLQQTHEVVILGATQNKENIDGYNQVKWKIPRSQIKRFQLEICSENAIRFQQIYSGISCQDSLALKHLSVKLFPFQIILIKGQIYEGLATSRENLTQLEQFFKKIVQ